jgi:branched-chain amino acid transport system ATP-binding protein
MLELRAIEVRYGSVPAVTALSMHVDQGEIVALLGANGAGKSTTLRAISGLHRATRGTINFDGVRIDKLPAHRILRLGLGQVPEGRRIFPSMSVLENLEMGAFRRPVGKERRLDRVFEVFPILGERRKQLGGTLSGGEQQMLAIGRALMAEPRLLLFDEPSLGLAPKIVEQIFSIIGAIRESGTTILLVEQNANQALRLADRGYVMETGTITAEDRADVLLDDPRIREAYLGEQVTS